MKNIHKMLHGIFFFLVLTFVSSAFAHQPRITNQWTNQVIDPEISKAYYAQLPGEPQKYIIEATGSFNLYVNILVPDIIGQKKDVTAIIFKNGDYTHPIITLGGLNAPWKYMFEPFGYNAYWQWAEYKSKASSGTYEIQVSSPDNMSKYSLAVGEIENFDVHETLNALKLVPQLKRDFFNESPRNFLFSPMGYWTILIEFLVAWILIFILRFFAKKLWIESFQNWSKNSRRLVGFTWWLLAVLLFIVTISTSWNLWLLFGAGLCFFEAILGGYW